MDAIPPLSTLIAARPSRLRRLKRRFDAIFMLTVLIPTAVAVLYYGFIASDVYISESRFVIKSPQRQTPTTIGALLQGTGFSRSQDDTYSVHDYILSRDALKVLDDRLHVRAAFSDSKIDPVNRFPSLDRDQSFEALYKHYLKHVRIDYDTVSAITVLRVHAYTAENAEKINDMLLQMSEQLVNNLNARSRQDLIEVAKDEVGLAEQRAKTAALALASYRSERGVFDPERQGALQLQEVSRMQEELLSAEAQLAQVQQVSPGNPQVVTLNNRVETLRRAIAGEAAKVTGGAASLSAKSPVFDRLVLDKTFADRQLASAMASLESARSEAQRKQLYLERLVQPNLPDMAMEPRRMRSVWMVFLLGLMLWGVISMVVSSVREHTD